jgi:hypothetical protein
MVFPKIRKMGAVPISTKGSQAAKIPSKAQVGGEVHHPFYLIINLNEL